MTPDLRERVFARALSAYAAMAATRAAFQASPNARTDRAYCCARKAWHTAFFSAQAIDPEWHPADPSHAARRAMLEMLIRSVRLQAHCSWVVSGSRSLNNYLDRIPKWAR